MHFQLVAYDTIDIVDIEPYYISLFPLEAYGGG